MANNDKYAQLLEDKEFVKWFWFGNNGNTLIKHLNSDKSREEIVSEKNIRRMRMAACLTPANMNEIECKIITGN